MEKRNQAHIFGGTFLIFLAAGSKQEIMIFLLGGTKSLSQTLFETRWRPAGYVYRKAGILELVETICWEGDNRVYQNTLKFEIHGVHHFSTQEIVPIEATKSFRALSLS